MKTKIASAFAGTFALASSLAHGAYTDITIHDGLPGVVFAGGDNRFADGQREYGEVEDGSSQHASWDLRAFGYNFSTNSLMVQTGMNIASEHVNNAQSSTASVTASSQVDSDYFGIGTIFIKKGGEFGAAPGAAPPIGVNGQVDPYGNIRNGSGIGVPAGSLVGGFDYAITLRTGGISGTLDYLIYDLNEDSRLTAAFYEGNQEAGPYAFLPENGRRNSNVNPSDGVVPGSGGNAIVSSIADINGSYGNMQSFGQSNYMTEFSLAGLSLPAGSFFYLTLECGNDAMVGQLNRGTSLTGIPEPGSTVGLMGLLVGGAFLRSRRRA